MPKESTVVLLVGSHAGLLEGMSQSLAALGFSPIVATQMQEAKEIASAKSPVMVVLHASLASRAVAAMLSLRVACSGGLVLYHTPDDEELVLPPSVQRAVVANLSLPLERQRLIALTRHVAERAQASGRGRRESPPIPPERLAP